MKHPQLVAFLSALIIGASAAFMVAFFGGPSWAVAATFLIVYFGQPSAPRGR